MAFLCLVFQTRLCKNFSVQDKPLPTRTKPELSFPQNNTGKEKHSVWSNCPLNSCSLSAIPTGLPRHQYTVPQLLTRTKSSRQGTSELERPTQHRLGDKAYQRCYNRLKYGARQHNMPEPVESQERY